MAQVVEVDDRARYLHATAKSKVPKDGVDDVEFLMVPDEKIVTTRSASRGNFYVYPYQVPIGDGGYQKQRLEGVCVCVCVCTYMYECVYVHVCMYTYM